VSTEDVAIKINIKKTWELHPQRKVRAAVEALNSARLVVGPLCPTTLLAAHLGRPLLLITDGECMSPYCPEVDIATLNDLHPDLPPVMSIDAWNSPDSVVAAVRENLA
jgi:hypothetical protein